MRKNLNKSEIKEMCNNLNEISRIKKIMGTSLYRKFSTGKAENFNEMILMVNSLIELGLYENKVGRATLIIVCQIYFRKFINEIVEYMTLELPLQAAIKFWETLDQLPTGIIKAYLPKLNKVLIEYYCKYGILNEKECNYIYKTSLDYNYTPKSNCDLNKDELVIMDSIIKKALKGKTVHTILASQIWDFEHDNDVYEGCFNHYFDDWIFNYKLECEAELNKEEENEDDNEFTVQYDDGNECDYLFICIKDEDSEKFYNIERYIRCENPHYQPQSDGNNDNFYIDIPFYSIKSIGIHFYIELLNKGLC